MRFIFFFLITCARGIVFFLLSPYRISPPLWSPPFSPRLSPFGKDVGAGEAVNPLYNEPPPPGPCSSFQDGLFHRLQPRRLLTSLLPRWLKGGRTLMGGRIPPPRLRFRPSPPDPRFFKSLNLRTAAPAWILSSPPPVMSGLAWLGCPLFPRTFLPSHGLPRRNRREPSRLT